MALKYLLDTNATSEPAQFAPNLHFMQRFSQTLWDEMAVSSVTWHEMHYGMRMLSASKRRQRIENYLIELEKQIVILPYDNACAEWHTEERSRLRKAGRTPAYADTQIAAVVAASNLILVTRNEKDFSNFEQLRIENWFRYRCNT